MAVPVLVKDGKPCSGSGGTMVQTHTPQIVHVNNGINSLSGNSATTSANGSNITTSTTNNHHHHHHHTNLHLIVSDVTTTNSQSPDTSSSHLIPYSGSISSPNTQQIIQQSCNNSLSMPNSLAAAYRNQNNFIANGHQQQCTGYLPLQGRAW